MIDIKELIVAAVMIISSFVCLGLCLIGKDNKIYKAVFFTMFAAIAICSGLLGIVK